MPGMSSLIEMLCTAGWTPRGMSQVSWGVFISEVILYTIHSTYNWMNLGARQSVHYIHVHVQVARQVASFGTPENELIDSTVLIFYL